jgi:large subunit ribosomal protein L29
MLARDIRELTETEILQRLTELKEERFRLRFRSATETLDDPLRLRVVRKDIARLQTVLREKRTAAGAGAQGARNG